LDSDLDLDLGLGCGPFYNLSNSLNCMTRNMKQKPEKGVQRMASGAQRIGSGGLRAKSTRRKGKTGST